MEPVAVLLMPIVLLESEASPVAVLSFPVVLAMSALIPVAVLNPPRTRGMTNGRTECRDFAKCYSLLRILTVAVLGEPIM
jgi:hypothetical protein